MRPLRSLADTIGSTLALGRRRERPGASERVARALGGVLSLNRAGFGIASLVAPARFGRGWIGEVARDPATHVLTRGLGARDVALGSGALIALATHDGPRASGWLAGQALADASDLGATIAAGGRLPRRGFRFAIAMAGASSAVGSATAVALRSRTRR